MRVFTITGGNQGVAETNELPTQLPEQGMVWIACARREFEVIQAQIQATLQHLCGTQLVDLHVSDLLSNQLPSHYDYTSQYDILVFRRLGTSHTETDLSRPGELSMAHHGVLFLDELPEFRKNVLEVLRQPLEEGVIRLARAAQNVVFPCRVMLVAAMNPCPCGFYNVPGRTCRCNPTTVPPPGSDISRPRDTSRPTAPRTVW